MKVEIERIYDETRDAQAPSMEEIYVEAYAILYTHYHCNVSGGNVLPGGIRIVGIQYYL